MESGVPNFRILPALRWFLLLLTLLGGGWLIDRAGRATPGDHVLVGSLALACFMLALLVGLHPSLRAHRERRRDVSHRVRLVFWTAGVLLLPWATLQQLFGAYNFSAVLFTVQEGLGSHLDTWLILPGVVSFFLVIVFLHLGQGGFRRVPQPGLSMLLAGVGMLAINPLHVFLFQVTIWDRFFPVEPIHKAFAPVEITAEADRPLNLVLVFLEGTEATYGTRDMFGDAYDPLRRLGAGGRVFEGVEQVEAIGHSIAGMVAAQCGLPLVPRGLFPTRWAERWNEFLPGHSCLGDVLSKRGYVAEFLVGAAIDYGGIDRFYGLHGFDRVTGLRELHAPRPAAGRRPAVHRHETMRWGVHDSVVFEAALERAAALSAGGAPWAMVIETIGPHGPDAFLSPPCRRPGEGATHKDILRGVRCLAELSEDFVNRLFAISPPEDTLVVLVSDHLAHKTVSATSQLRKLERHNTAIFLGAGVAPGRVGTPGSMLDIYPTILESLGYGLQGHQAGMGISLLQPSRETLVGQLGTAEIDRRLARDTDLSAIVWQGPDALATK